MRPQTLAEVASLAAQGESFDMSTTDFLHEFYAHPSEQALAERPQLLQPIKGDLGQIQDAYLAAAAEELARKFNVRNPRWTDDEERKLHKPWFASDLASLRAVLIWESPPGFRSRNLFVSENALSRV